MSIQADISQILGKGFTKFTLLKEKPPKGYMSSGKRLTKIQTTTRPDHVWQKFEGVIIQMMVLESEPQHAEGTHILVQIQIPDIMQQSQDEQFLDQLFKFILYNFLELMELKLRFHPRPRHIETLG